MQKEPLTFLKRLLTQKKKERKIVHLLTIMLFHFFARNTRFVKKIYINICFLFKKITVYSGKKKTT